MTISEARELVRAEPKRWRAAFIEAPGTPLRDHPQASVVLHEKVGSAYDQLRARKESLVKNGWKPTFGNLGRNFIVFERGPSEVLAIGLDKPKKRERG